MRGHEPGAARAARPLRAAGAARGPPREAGPVGRGPGAPSYNAEACHAGRLFRRVGSRELERRPGRGTLGPAGASRAAGSGLEGVYLPLVERQCRHLSASARHFRRRGSGSGCGSGMGLGCPTPAGPHAPPATPAGLTEGLKRSALRPCLAQRGFRAASPSGLGTLGSAGPLPRSHFTCKSGGLEPLWCAHPPQVEG